MAASKTNKISVRRPNWSTNEIVKLAERGAQYLNSKVADKSQFWKDTAEHINSIGGNCRTEEEVQRKWTDLKSQVKVRERRRRQSMKVTGGGPPPCDLACWEQLIVDALPACVIEGISSGTDVFDDGARDSSKRSDSEEKNRDQSVPTKKICGKDVWISGAVGTSNNSQPADSPEKLSVGTSNNNKPADSSEKCHSNQEASTSTASSSKYSRGNSKKCTKQKEDVGSYNQIIDIEERKLAIEERKVEQLEKIADSLSKIHGLLKHKIVEDDVFLTFFES